MTNHGTVDVQVKVGSKENVPLMKDRQKKGDKVLAFLRTVSGMLAHAVAVGFTFYIVYIAQPGSSLFSWHPTLMAMAFSFFMTEAILVFSPDSSIFLKASRKTKVRIHWLLQACAVVCGLVGFIIIVVNKVQNNKDHFTTWHGTLGLITTIYVIVQALCGIFLLYPQVPKKWNWKPMQLKVYHATFGLLGYTLACVTVALAMYSNFVTSFLGSYAWLICLLGPGVSALVIMNQVTNTYLPVARKSAPL